MSTQDYLKYQVRLLLSEFGRRAVLEAIASAVEVAPEELEDEMRRIEANKKKKAVKHPKSLEEQIEGITGASETERQIIARLGRMYDAKQFLPNLRDAEQFLRRSGLALKHHKSRREALPEVLKALSSMDGPELERILADATRSPEESDYAILAKQLMGKQH